MKNVYTFHNYTILMWKSGGLPLGKKFVKHAVCNVGKCPTRGRGLRGQNLPVQALWRGKSMIQLSLLLPQPGAQIPMGYSSTALAWEFVSNVGL